MFIEFRTVKIFVQQKTAKVTIYTVL